jgi:hypothetical protein
MVVKRKRLQVTLSDELWAVLDELHKLTDTPKASILSDMLDQMAPMFQTTVQALRVIKDQPREAERILTRFSADAVNRLTAEQLSFADQLDAADGRTLKGQRVRRGGAKSTK